MSSSSSPFRDYILDPAVAFQQYIIVDGTPRPRSLTSPPAEYRRGRNTSVVRAYVKGQKSLVQISKQLFIPTYYNQKRLEVLLLAFEKAIVLAHQIFLLQEGAYLFLCVAEYCFIDSGEGNLRTLAQFLAIDND